MAFYSPVEIKGWLLYPPEEASLCAIMIFLCVANEVVVVCVCLLDKKQATTNDILTLCTFLDAFLQYDPLTVLWQFILTTSPHRSFCPRCVCVCGG